MNLGNKLERECLPGPRIVFLLGVVERIASPAGDEIDHALGPGMGMTVKNLVERPSARDFVAIVNRSTEVVGVGRESKGIRTLIVVDMPTEYNVNSARLEDISQEPHLLVAEVCPATN